MVFMLLQSVVAELDRELSRLHTLRSIVAGLSRTPKAVAQLVSYPVARVKQDVIESVTTGSEQSKPQRKARADAGQPRGRRPRKPEVTTESRAFAAAIPSGPVLFNPTRLAEEKARREQGKEAPRLADVVQPPEDLDALARSMAAQWGTARAQ